MSYINHLFKLYELATLWGVRFRIKHDADNEWYTLHMESVEGKIVERRISTITLNSIVCPETLLVTTFVEMTKELGIE